MPILKSSFLHRAEFKDGTLYLTFRNGRSYILLGVPIEHYEGLLHAKSAGRYFNTFLKGRF